MVSLQLFTKDDAQQPAQACEQLCMDQLVVVMLLFRMWAVLSAFQALPARGVLHPGCCFHRIIAHPLGCQKSWAKNRGWLPADCSLPGASQRGTRRCMVHMCRLIWQENILGSCLPARSLQPSRPSQLLEQCCVLSKEKQCSSEEESMCKMLFLQIFIIIVQYLYLATFSF